MLETTHRPALWRRGLAEGIGAGLLVAVVVGSGIAAERLSPGDVGLQLLENALATAAGLAVLILVLGPVSGAHFNPVVTVADRCFGGISTRDAVAYVGAQVVGACVGALLANVMFSEPVVRLSDKVRDGGGQWTAEVVATAGLLLVVFGVARSGRPSAAPFAVGAYIGAAYFFTSSTGFANPAVTIGRTLSDTFAGIAPGSVPAFVGCQLAGLVVGVGLVAALHPETPGQRGRRRSRSTAVGGVAGEAYALMVNVGLRHNVQVSGKPDGQPMVFAHGFGCDQNMWRHVAPRFEDEFKVVLFDHVGAGGADASAFDPERHTSLRAYADDVLDICRELELHDVVFVGHSVSAMIGVLAAAEEPTRFAKLVLVGPSPRYLDDVDYVGGFAEGDINELLESLESNYLGWSSAMAPVIMGNADRPELGAELTESFCRSDPAIARQFARVTFLSDNRADLGGVDVPTLVLQCTNDVIAPVAVGEYVAREMPNAELVLLDATGHCPNLSAPDETADAIAAFVS